MRWLQVRGRIPGGRALATVFVDRAFDVLTLVVFLAVSLPFVTGADWLLRMRSGVFRCLSSSVSSSEPRGFIRADRLVTAGRDRGLVRRLVRDTLEGLAEPLGRRRGAALVAISFVMWSLWATSVARRSLGRSRAHSARGDLRDGGDQLGCRDPSSPGFIGTYQWLGVSVLALLEVGKTEALAFAILIHAVWYVPTLLVGGCLLLGGVPGRCGQRRPSVTKSPRRKVMRQIF